MMLPPTPSSISAGTSLMLPMSARTAAGRSRGRVLRPCRLGAFPGYRDRRCRAVRTSSRIEILLARTQELRAGRAYGTAPAASPIAAKAHHAWWKAVRAEVPAVLAVTATRTLTPSTAPSCRRLELTADPVPNRAGGRDWAAVADWTGRVSAAPSPMSTVGASQSARKCGVALVEMANRTD